MISRFNSPDNHLSLWLIPDTACFQRLNQLILRLHAEYGGHAFEPHLTLLGGLSVRDKDALSGVRQLTASSHALRILFPEIGTSEEYYRSLFMKAENNRLFLGTRQKALEIFRMTSTDFFMPHISLMYGFFSGDVKRQIATDLACVVPSEVRFSSFRLVRTEGLPEEWETVGMFQLQTEVDSA